MTSEDIGFGYDTFLFAQPVITQQIYTPIAEFCYYTAECYIVIVLDDYILDHDDNFYREIDHVGLESTLINLVDNVIRDVQNSPEEYEDIVHDYVNNRLSEIKSVLYANLFTMTTAFLLHIPALINTARQSYKNYVDYRMTTNGDAIVLRLMTRNNNV